MRTRFATIVGLLALAGTMVSQGAHAQFRYGPAPARGFGYPTGPLTPPFMMRPLGLPAGVMSTPPQVWQSVGTALARPTPWNTLRGVGTVLFYPTPVH